MARMARQFETLVLLAAALVWPALASAQEPMVAPAAPRRAATPARQVRQPAPPQSEVVMAPTPDHEEPEILRSLPRPPAQPASLFLDAPPPGPPAPEWEHPYFQRDPLLDPMDWPAPGWFADVEVSVIKTHVNFPVFSPPLTALASLQNPAPVVQTGKAHLNWTAAPRVELGYRLPSGFGEFSLYDRNFNTFGNDTPITPDGPARRRTEFMVNYTDVDYATRELTPNAGWGLKFRGGLRVAQTFLGTRVDEPFAEAAAGSGIFAQRETNRTSAVGPHFGLDLERRLARPGFTLVGNIDVADLFTHVRQEFFAATTMPAFGGGFASQDVVGHFIQYVPVLTVQLGLNWQPPRLPNSRLYLGYFGQF